MSPESIQTQTHPDRGAGLSPMTIGLYQPSSIGLNTWMSLLQPSGCDIGCGNTPPKIHSS